MASRESILRDKTYKDDCEDDSHRIFYTLIGERKTPDFDPMLGLTSKLLTVLVVHLQSKGLVSEAELDQLLFDTVT